MITMSYLETKFPQYRCIAEYDLSTNDFPRESNGSLCESDIYIKCHAGTRIYHFGGSVLQTYVPSLGKGRNVVRFIYRDFINPKNTKTNVSTMGKDGKEVQKESVSIIDKDLFEKELRNKKNIIFDLEQTDEEVLFKFKTPDMEKLEKYLKPSTFGAGIRAHSVKNLPKNKEFSIPTEEMEKYREITKNIPKEDSLKLGKLTTQYLASLTNKKYSSEQQKADMRKVMLSGKEYVYYIGKWNEFLDYLKREIVKL